MASGPSVGRRVGAVVFTLAARIAPFAVVAGACSGAPPSVEAPPATVAPGLGPVPAGPGEGAFVVTTSPRSVDQLAIDASGLPNQAGELVELRNQLTGALVVAAVEKGKPVEVRDGWTATVVHADRVWNPAHCANLPHVLLGERYIAILRSGAGARPVDFEVFDSASKQFVSAPLVADDAEVFTLSLKAEGANTFSVLIDERGALVRRTVDVSTLGYRDLRLEQPTVGRVSFARSVPGGYMVDAGTRRGMRVEISASAVPARFVAATLDEPLIAGRAGELAVVDRGRELRLPPEVLSASIAGVSGPDVFIGYSTSTTSVAEAVGSLDRQSGSFAPVAGPQRNHLFVVAVASR